MGVHNLWELLAPVGRRVSVEALGNKKLAIDASIWIVQFMKAMRDDRGDMIRNAHLLGFFRRICKLLFLRVKPVFVFDGATPALKRRTVIARRRQQENARAKIRKTAEKLLLNHLRTRHLEEATAEARELLRKNETPSIEEKEESEDEQPTMTCEDVFEPGTHAPNDTGEMEHPPPCIPNPASSTVQLKENSDLGSMFGTAPPADSQGNLHSGTEIPLDIIDDGDDDDESEELLMLPFVQAQLDPTVLATLPPSMQLNLLVQMREQLVADNRQKFQRVAKVPASFSELQIEAYLKTVAFRREINQVQQAAAGRVVGGVPSTRIASETSREYIFSSSFSGEKQRLELHQNSSSVKQKELASESSPHKTPFVYSSSMRAKLRNQDYGDISGECSTSGAKLVRRLAADSDHRSMSEADHDHASILVVDEQRSTSRIRQTLEHHSEKARKGKLPLTGADEEGVRCPVLSLAEPNWTVSFVDDGGAAEDREDELFKELVSANPTFVDSQELHINNELDLTESHMDSETSVPDRDFQDNVDVVAESYEIEWEDGTEDMVSEDGRRCCKPDEDILGVACSHHGDEESVGGVPIGSMSCLFKENLPVSDQVLQPRQVCTKNSGKAPSVTGLTFSQHVTTAVQLLENSFSSLNSCGQTIVCSPGAEMLDRNCGISPHSLCQQTPGDHSDVFQVAPPQPVQTTGTSDFGHRMSDCEMPTAGANVQDVDGDEEQEHSSAENQEYSGESNVDKDRQDLTADTEALKVQSQVTHPTIQECNHVLQLGIGQRNLSVCANDFGIMENGDEKHASRTTVQGYKRKEDQHQRGSQQEEPISSHNLWQQTPGDYSDVFHVASAQPTQTTGTSDFGHAETDATLQGADRDEEQEQLSAENQEYLGEGNVHRVRKDLTADRESLMEVQSKAAHPTIEECNDVLRLGIGEPNPSSCGNDSGIMVTGDEKRASSTTVQGYERKEDQHQRGSQQEDPPGIPPNIDSIQSMAADMEALMQEQSELREAQQINERNADSVTGEMFAECQELLQMFGLPYIIAPMEAEAQCAYMDLAGLVDGVVTNDSDVFLFGGKNVYKNIFDDRKYVETYHMKDIDSELGLTREKLIQMALLLGSDYTEGVSGIGIVNAIEVVNAFAGEDGLQLFKEWIESPDASLLKKIPRQSKKRIRKAIAADDDDADKVDDGSLEEGAALIEGTYTASQQKFMEKHRAVSKNWNLPESFPSEAVVAAYQSPHVDDSQEAFTWGRPDLAALRKVCFDGFGWNQSKADELLLPVLREYDRRETQLRLDSFYSFNQRFAKIRSSRIQKAVSSITGKRPKELMDIPLHESPIPEGCETEGLDDDIHGQSKKQGTKRQRGGRTGRGTRGKKNATTTSTARAEVGARKRKATTDTLQPRTLRSSRKSQASTTDDAREELPGVLLEPGVEGTAMQMNIAETTLDTSLRGASEVTDDYVHDDVNTSCGHPHRAVVGTALHNEPDSLNTNSLIDERNTAGAEGSATNLPHLEQSQLRVAEPVIDVGLKAVPSLRRKKRVRT